MNQIAIIITAYNRAESLSNLLKSLSKVEINQKVTLIISIDNNGTKEVNEISENYSWQHGDKKVIIHKEKKGLVNHFIWTGDQTEEYDYIIFLEDDLIVSPCLINSANQIISFYQNDDKVAAASLYNPILCEMTGCKFYQIDDGYDFYFLQQPYWGNIWFKNKWRDFKKYLQTYNEKKELLPKSIASWKHSFKKIYIQYLVEAGKYVVTPRVSIISNNGVAGLHSSTDLYQYQNVLLIRNKEYRLCLCTDSLARYDAFMEIVPEILKYYNPNLKKYNFSVDTKGIHTKYNQPYVLTTKPVKDCILSFSSLMKPIEASIIFGEKGNSELRLCKKEDVIESRKFYFRRRFKDIEKNYWVGVNAGLCICLATFNRLISLVKEKTIGRL